MNTKRVEEIRGIIQNLRDAENGDDMVPRLLPDARYALLELLDELKSSGLDERTPSPVHEDAAINFLDQLFEVRYLNEPPTWELGEERWIQVEDGRAVLIEGDGDVLSEVHLEDEPPHLVAANPKNQGVVDMLYGRLRADTTHPCKYGHEECSGLMRGYCSNEVYGALYDILDEEGQAKMDNNNY